MFDLNAIRQRAAARADVANPANPANRLIDVDTPQPRTSQLATLATLASVNQPARGLSEAQAAQSCSTCRYLSRVKTCREPVAAGLLSSFGIVWPEPGRGATCPTWRRNPADAVMAVLVAAGRGGWSDAQMHRWLADADEHPDAVLDALRAGGPTP